MFLIAFYASVSVSKPWETVFDVTSILAIPQPAPYDIKLQDRYVE